ncbi:Lhr family ATP dependent helicase [Paenibacillus cellulosilyticus]|uniref:Lhr family ATP dependent helicase n=1 Tax=Paenibacillus cellulosilyticus TaxID=375489 RepID=A0A2V2YRX3_9BACL|nr:DEAD/DEAH box helicase [Paenibacillus cellulosilyticus]PWW00762.1 Lhr family ATP dependent helicase [Paenibacillus cellulosilyticus]QKS45617.1 DEAD/DEAH box helicase [Paenibacillus cellulosilyticus]
MNNSPLHTFHPVIADWFSGTFGQPTDVQTRAWASIQAGRHTLIAAPTGSGKTLAAMLPCLNNVVTTKIQTAKPRAGVKVLYLSPLKALNNDVHYNLVSFIEAIDRSAAQREPGWPGIRCAVRTGDTPSSQRASMAKRPPDVLLTTPESLYILLTSEQGRAMLRTVQYVVVDEIHDLASDKRGSHLSLSLERLADLCDQPFQRIGVSATQKPMWRVARFLGGWEPALSGQTNVSIELPSDADADEKAPHPLGYVPRQVDIIESVMTKAMQVLVTMPDLSKPMTTREAVWQPLLERLFSLMEGCRTVLIFVNSRRLCERVCLRLNDAAGYELSRAHHGSLAKERRLEAERMLKSGELRCIVATSSLELGIDVGHVDLVIQIDPPFDAASGIQRIGRAGHSVGDVSRGAIIVRHRGALAESAVLAKLVAEREIEPIQIPRHPLDVLSQHTVSMVAGGEWTTTKLYQLVTRSDTFRLIPYTRLLAMLQVLSGFYPFARPLLDWNRDTDVLAGRRSSGIAALTGAGTIPSSSAFPVHHLESRVHLGELDEEYVHESNVGDVFQLGTNSWMIRRIDRDRVYVTEAANSFSEIPFWRNEAGGRSSELGMKIGAFVRELEERLMIDSSDDVDQSFTEEDQTFVRTVTESQTAEWLMSAYRMDAKSAYSLIDYANHQHSFCGLPTDRRIIVEHYQDVSNKTHVIIHNWLGRRLNRTWLLAIERQFEQLLPYRLYGNAKDNGIEFVLSEWDPSWLQSIWHVTPGNVEPLIMDAITGSPLLAIAFRHLAETSLLLSRSFTRTPLWQKRLRSEELLKEAMPYASQFPFLDEAMRECLNRFLDVDGLQKVLTAIGSGEVAFDIRETQYPSPMATQFIAEYVNMRIYEGDGLDDTIRMQLLNVSRELAGSVFGEDAVRGAVTPELLEAERRRMTELAGQLSTSDDVLTLLKQRGDMGTDELVKAGGESVLPLIAELCERGAIVQVELGHADADDELPRWICRDEQEVYAHFPSDAASVQFIIGRYAEHELSFTEPSLCERYPQLTLPEAHQVVDTLIEQGKVEQAPFADGPNERLWTGRRTAQRLIRMSIGEARKRSQPAHPNKWFVQMAMRQYALGGTQQRGEEGLRAVISRLQGLFLPLSHWETIIFPSRLLDYRPEQLDLLCATGDVVWLGRKSNAEREGRIAFFLAESKPLYAPYLTGLDSQDSTQPALLQQLQAGGASFLTKLARDAGRTPTDMLTELLDLVWEGQASNDQFAPLRLHAGKKQADWARSGSGLGRWYWTGSLASDIAIETVNTSPTGLPIADAASVVAGAGNHAQSSAMHWVRHLLDNYGIVTKELVAAVSPLSWEVLLPVLKQLEEWGTITRGTFVDGEAVLQFTTAEIAEAVRAQTPLSADSAVTVLASVDPANPYGIIADWPTAETCAFARKAGHYLVLRGDQWLFWIENNGRRIHMMSDSSHIGSTDERNTRSHAINLSDSSAIAELRSALAAIMRRQRMSKIVIELWNGQPILDCAISEELRGMGAERDGQRLVLWPSSLR